MRGSTPPNISNPYFLMCGFTIVTDKWDRIERRSTPIATQELVFNSGGIRNLTWKGKLLTSVWEIG